MLIQWNVDYMLANGQHIPKNRIQTGSLMLATFVSAEVSTTTALNFVGGLIDICCQLVSAFLPWDFQNWKNWMKLKWVIKFNTLWYKEFQLSLLPLVICVQLSDPYGEGSSKFGLKIFFFSKVHISRLVKLNSTLLTQFRVKGLPSI